ncbi:ATP-binding protein [Cellulomonas sp. URHE0023]|uniref:ATP-binding protein n=1 Tax=Cellulomonas sp. URHE0023 TaxID=1380354 RepID=UPI0009DFF160|nr:ATP-binding protein [Cellulomonas sp. URHE0023]
MLGDQLIKNDRIALAEIIKNAYDADATLVEVDFDNFASATMRARPESGISIQDNGDGMSAAIVLEHWINPATPGKLERKQVVPTTPRGRVLQGEKGIGRFAIFKIGSRAKVITRRRGEPSEQVVTYDLRFLDEGQAGGEGNLNESQSEAAASEQSETLPPPRFLDQIPVEYLSRSPEVFVGPGAGGTRIEISSLRSGWGVADIRRARQDVSRLQPLTIDALKSRTSSTDKFDVHFLASGEEMSFAADIDATRNDLFENRAVLRVRAHFDDRTSTFDLTVNGERRQVRLDDPAVAGLLLFREYFGSVEGRRGPQDVECGPFDADFFVFDFRPSAPMEYRLDKADRELLRQHRVYLYRDGIRVMPYGDPEDDWLRLDIIRGTKAARHIFSNDQTVGFVWITQRSNPDLRDKTNREGLVDAGNASRDFVALLTVLVSYLRTAYFQSYLAAGERREVVATNRVSSARSSLTSLATDPLLPPARRAEVRDAVGALEVHLAELERRVRLTEDLAGVGMSVESASHDILAAAGRAVRLAHSLRERIEDLVPGNMWLFSQMDALIEDATFVNERLTDVQGLFVSTRKRPGKMSVIDYVKRTQRIFAGAIGRDRVRVLIEEPFGPLVVKSTDAALLQVFVNLFDNAIYWLRGEEDERRIHVRIDASRECVWFGDSGPGVAADYREFIFEPFYSGKGDDGKGLGLYIARQVGIRSGFTIALSNDAPLDVKGAVFQISFGEAI